MKLGIGSPAQFDYWRTSEVVNIESPEGGAVEAACQSQNPSPSQSQEIEEYNEAETLPYPLLQIVCILHPVCVLQLFPLRPESFFLKSLFCLLVYQV
jgi:hypothetical protein